MKKSKLLYNEFNLIMYVMSTKMKTTTQLFKNKHINSSTIPCLNLILSKLTRVIKEALIFCRMEYSQLDTTLDNESLSLPLLGR